MAASRFVRCLLAKLPSPRILNNDFWVCDTCRHCGIAPDGRRLNKDEDVSSTSEVLEGTAPGAPTENGTPNGSAYVFYSYSVQSDI